MAAQATQWRRRLPPIWLVLLADVCRRAVSSAGGTTLLALSTTGKIDVAALQTLPIGRILPWAWATHATLKSREETCCALVSSTMGYPHRYHDERQSIQQRCYAKLLFRFPSPLRP